MERMHATDDSTPRPLSPEQYQYMCDLKRTLDATVRELHYKSAVVPLY